LVLLYVMCCSVTSLTVLLTCDCMSVSGSFLLAVCTHPRGGTGHVHPAWWCLLDAPASARRKGFWWVGGMPKVVCMISMGSHRSVLSRGWSRMGRWVVAEVLARVKCFSGSSIEVGGQARQRVGSFKVYSAMTITS
jgi:hypothetical protein